MLGQNYKEYVGYNRLCWKIALNKKNTVNLKSLKPHFIWLQALSVSSLVPRCGIDLACPLVFVRRESLDHLPGEAAATCPAMTMFSTSIKPDPIKALNNRSQNSMVSLFLRIIMQARYSPSRFWVDCTTLTAEVLDL